MGTREVLRRQEFDAEHVQEGDETFARHLVETGNDHLSNEGMDLKKGGPGLSRRCGPFRRVVGDHGEKGLNQLAEGPFVDLQWLDEHVLPFLEIKGIYEVEPVVGRPDAVVDVHQELPDVGPLR